MDNKFYDSSNENSSIHSDKKDKKMTKSDSTVNNNNIYNIIIESLNGEKQDTDKIKALIIAEQDIHFFAKDKKK